MKKENLIEQLNTAKSLSSTVDIDKVIELIKQIEVGGLTDEIAGGISKKLELILDSRNGDLVDTDSAEFEFSYDNRIELSRVDVNTSNIIESLNDILYEFIIEEGGRK